jgi:hypothetical protein
MFASAILARDIHWETDQFGRELGQPFHPSLGGSELDGHVLAFDAARLDQCIAISAIT